MEVVEVTNITYEAPADKKHTRPINMTIAKKVFNEITEDVITQMIEDRCGQKPTSFDFAVKDI